jgi:RNA polymerase sigma-70 factor (ECF subfamily)
MTVAVVVVATLDPDSARKLAETTAACGPRDTISHEFAVHSHDLTGAPHLSYHLQNIDSADGRMNSPQKTDDTGTGHIAEIIGRCLRNERDAFRQLVEEHQRYVFSLAFRMLRDDEDARDVVQETFIRVWKNLHTFDVEAKFTTWLYTITVNLAYDLLKSKTRKRRWFRTPGSDESQEPAGATEDEMKIVNRDLAAKIRELAGSLPPKQQLVFVLRDLQDLTVDEVAHILSMSTGTVKTNLCYARKFIRAHMQRLDGMEGRRP